MLRSLFLFVLSAITLLFGCSSNDGIEKDPIDGIWDVHNINGGFAGINDDYPQGTIIWSFDAQNSMLTVTNNNVTNTIYMMASNQGNIHIPPYKQIRCAISKSMVKNSVVSLFPTMNLS